jgi:hypothetical protein
MRLPWDFSGVVADMSASRGGSAVVQREPRRDYLHTPQKLGAVWLSLRIAARQAAELKFERAAQRIRDVARVDTVPETKGSGHVLLPDPPQAPHRLAASLSECRAVFIR